MYDKIHKYTCKLGCINIIIDIIALIKHGEYAANFHKKYE